MPVKYYSVLKAAFDIAMDYRNPNYSPSFA
jgi:hypothetical protein